jgi:hypothetical protein
MKRFLVTSSLVAKVMILAMLWMAVVPSSDIFARVYKYKDDQGKTHFTDDPSKIPLKYRREDSLKKFRGVAEPSPSSEASPGISSKKTGSGPTGGPAGRGKDQGLSSEEVTQVNKSIQVLRAGVALANQNKNMRPNFNNGRRLVDAIQKSAPQKISLANELEGTRVPVLKEVLGFLKRSIAKDEQSKSVGQGLTRRIAAMIDRVTEEGQQQAELISKLEKALKDSEKKKAEAANNKSKK